eukprot:3620303-Karenia_brevis.AAC.1
MTIQRASPDQEPPGPFKLTARDASVFGASLKRPKCDEVAEYIQQKRPATQKTEVDEAKFDEEGFPVRPTKFSLWK